MTEPTLGASSAPGSRLSAPESPAAPLAGTERHPGVAPEPQRGAQSLDAPGPVGGARGAETAAGPSGGRSGCEIAGTWGYSATFDLDTGTLTWSPCPGCEGPVTGVDAGAWHKRSGRGRYERAGSRVTFKPCGCTAHIPN